MDYKRLLNLMVIRGFLGKEIIFPKENLVEEALSQSGELRNALLSTWIFRVWYGEGKYDYCCTHPMPKKLWEDLVSWGKENNILILPPNEWLQGYEPTLVGKSWFEEIERISGKETLKLCRNDIINRVQKVCMNHYQCGQNSTLLVVCNKIVHTWPHVTRVVDEEGRLYSPLEVKKKKMVVVTPQPPKRVVADFTEQVWRQTCSVKEEKNLIVFIEPGNYRENVEIIINSKYLKGIPVGVRVFHDMM